MVRAAPEHLITCEYKVCTRTDTKKVQKLSVQKSTKVHVSTFQQIRSANILSGNLKITLFSVSGLYEDKSLMSGVTSVCRSISCVSIVSESVCRELRCG